MPHEGQKPSGSSLGGLAAQEDLASPYYQVSLFFNPPRYLSSFVEEESLYILMEYAEHGDLHKVAIVYIGSQRALREMS